MVSPPLKVLEKVGNSIFDFLYSTTNKRTLSIIFPTLLKNIQKKRWVLFMNQAIDNRKINFTMVENELIDSKELDVYEKLTYIVLCRFAKDGQCFPSYQTIADKVGCGRKKAIDSVKRLLEVGIVNKHCRKNEFDENTSNVYYIEGFASKTQGSILETPPLVSDKHHPSVPETPKQDLINNTNFEQSVSQSEPTDELTDIIKPYTPELRVFLLKVILSLPQQYKRLIARHIIDDALFKYRTMLEQKPIKNHDEYFRKCLITSIEEEGLRNFE
jgi:DNA-binding Lrp family transcriptional regulator